MGHFLKVDLSRQSVKKSDMSNKMILIIKTCDAASAFWPSSKTVLCGTNLLYDFKIVIKLEPAFNVALI